MEAKKEEENGYFRPIEDEYMETPEGKVIYPIVQIVGKQGLQNGYVDSFETGQGFMNEFYFRRFFVRNFSWFVPNKRWVQSFSNYIIANEIHTVLEVAAGTGYGGALVSKWMKDHYPSWEFNWICTDASPPPGKAFSDVRTLGADEAANQFKEQADMLFFAWWPYEGDPGDLAVSRTFTEMGKPVIVIGESWGGCTGSKDFWQEATGRESWRTGYEEEGKIPTLTVEWLSWGLYTFDGIHDGTFAVTKRVVQP